MLIDDATAVLICAGPSLDRVSPTGWRAIEQAGAVVSVNGSLVATTCIRNCVRFTYAASMDVATGLADCVPGLAQLWKQTPSWRVSAHGTTAEAESYVKEVEWWGDAPDEGYVGGSTAMVVGNWLCNPWPDDPVSRSELAAIAVRSGKRIGPRGFKRLAYFGLDMIPGQGGHAEGAGDHKSGFSQCRQRYDQVCSGWRLFFLEARERGIEVVNLTPGSGLKQLPRLEVPADWLMPA
jgi:hypothetical protein